MRLSTSHNRFGRNTSRQVSTHASAPHLRIFAGKARSAAGCVPCQLKHRLELHRVPIVVCRAEEAQPLNLVNVVSVLSKASQAWDKYDENRDGSLSIQECEAIFNSQEFRQAVEMMTNVSYTPYTAADLERHFRTADRDGSGSLSRTEFLALYLSLATERVKKNPLLLAEALLGFLDHDKNGVLEGGELKALLAILGFAPALLLPIPGFVKIEYRAILRRLRGGSEGSGEG